MATIALYSVDSQKSNEQIHREFLETIFHILITKNEIYRCNNCENDSESLVLEDCDN